MNDFLIQTAAAVAAAGIIGLVARLWGGRASRARGRPRDLGERTWEPR